MIINELVSTTKKLIFDDHTTKPKPTIILGLSGGPDSVFLFHLLNQLVIDGSINLVAVHVDHCWRENSAHDAEFCKQLCQEKNIPYELYKNGKIAGEIVHTGSQEDYGRRLRRHCFQDARTKHNADFIALAHHRQDQQETFFVRLLRGTSLNGLRCMDSLNGYYSQHLLLY
jgi:tRNA(Ile)-lysidine synthase